MSGSRGIFNRFVSHPLVVTLATLGALIQFGAYVLQTYKLIPHLPPTNLLVLGHLWILFLVVAIWGIASVQLKNVAYKNVFFNLHNLNHLYRQSLARTSLKILAMHGSDPASRNDTLRVAESDTLKNAITIISAIFTKLISRDVTTTIWLWNSQTEECAEYMCCKENIAADRPIRDRLAYDHDENSIFRACKEEHGKCCHYFSPDITKRANDPRGYHDQRSAFGEKYQSILIVPIRFRADNNQDLVGYLQIDTKSRNRLNNVEHLYLLSAFADQLYNFMSLMRRNYLF